MSFDPYTQETTRVEDIKDYFGNLKFKVILTEVEQDNTVVPLTVPTSWDATYMVKVISYCVDGAIAPITLIEELFDELKDAKEFFVVKVTEYTTLVAAETKGWQDIRIFNDKIHYKIIDPDCCKNCKWAKPVTKDNCLFNDYKQHKARFCCMNPSIAKVQKEIDPRVEDPRISNPPYHHDGNRVTVNFELAPIVQEDGICDDYSRNLEYLKISSMSQAHFEAHKTSTPEQIRDSVIQYEVNRSVDDKLANTTIKLISGNDGDSNQNGIDDDKEKPSNEMIIGNLGA